MFHGSHSADEEDGRTFQTRNISENGHYGPLAETRFNGEPPSEAVDAGGTGGCGTGAQGGAQ